jgi:hypothetical protein
MAQLIWPFAPNVLWQVVPVQHPPQRTPFATLQSNPIIHTLPVSIQSLIYFFNFQFPCFCDVPICTKLSDLKSYDNKFKYPNFSQTKMETVHSNKVKNVISNDKLESPILTNKKSMEAACRKHL